jgi:hypothetical protein
MAVSKLANSVKQEILRLYCETDATTTQLAKQFGISSSTVLRLLQDMMSPEEYREIVAQKNQMKGRRKAKSDTSAGVTLDSSADFVSVAQDDISATVVIGQVASEPEVDHDIDDHSDDHRLVLRSSGSKRVASAPKSKTAVVQLPLEVEAITAKTAPVHGNQTHSHNLAHNLVRVLPQESLEEAVEEIADEIADELSHLPHVDDESAVELDKIDEMVGDDFGDEDDDLPQTLSSKLHLTDDLDESDEDADDEDLEDTEDDDEDFEEPEDLDVANLGGAYLTGYQRQGVITILPLNEAELPLTCYMVVDKAAEIVTRPLREFQDLGMIPDEENSSRTVPVFGNHRVARRFSNHNQRVIKFPGDLIYATQDHLVKKGITRLFFDGNVYSLN